MGPAVKNVVVVVALTTLTVATQPDFTVDVRTAVMTPLPDGVTWLYGLASSSGSPGYRCDRQGLFALTLSPQRRRVEINMTFEESVGYSFNVADSITSGYAGDASTPSNHSGFHSLGKALVFYGPDNPAAGPHGFLHSDDFVAINPYTTLTLTVADQLVTADNGQRSLYINSDKLFARDRQRVRSPSGVRYDVFVAMNRMAYITSNPGRQGRGLCRVAVKFYPS